MTPEQREAFIVAALVMWDLLASYGDKRAGELAKDLRAEAATLDDDQVIAVVDKVFRTCAHQLVTMGQTLKVAVEMGSDYGAAFTAVQADAASEALRKKGDRQRRRARELRAKGTTIPTIAAELDVTVRRVQQLLKD